MPTLVSLPFHRQNTGEFCGPACAQMVLRGLGVSHERLHQHLLYLIAHASPTGDTGSWYSFPDGLTAVLNTVWRSHLISLGMDPGTRFALFVCDSHTRLTEVLRRTIEHRRCNAAPIVLGMKGEHWVVVRGYDVPDPSQPGPVNGWYLHNPFPVVSGASSTTAHADDDFCLRLHEDQRWPCSHMTAAYWEQDYVTPTEQGSARWDGKLLAICQVEDPTITGFHEIALTGGARSRFDEAPSVRERLGAPLPASRIRALADDLFATASFDHGSCVPRAMRNTMAGTPMLVNDNPADPGAAYYIVPFIRVDGEGDGRARITAMAIFDAYTGEYQEAGANPRGDVIDPALLDPAVIEQQFAARGFAPAPARVTTNAFPFRLVWQPSNESRSRFMPFLLPEPLDQSEPVELPESLVEAAAPEATASLDEMAPLEAREPLATPSADIRGRSGFEALQADDIVAASAPPAFIRLDGAEFPELTAPKP